MDKPVEDREAELAAARKVRMRRKEAVRQLAMAEKIMREDRDILRDLSR